MVGMGQWWGRKKSFFIPTYNELSLFMMSMAFLLVFFFNEQLRTGLIKLLGGPGDRGGIIVCLIFFIAGIVLSLYHVFTDRKKTYIEKNAMLFFAVITNAISGIFASAHILSKSTDAHSIFLLLPIWNIINCVILLISLRLRIINERSITDESARGFEILVGFIIIMGIFLACQFVFKLYWALTFSICVVYATSFSDALSSMFHPERQIEPASLSLAGKFRKGTKAERFEKCGFCGRIITKAETPWVIKRKLIVCKECYYKIQGGIKDTKSPD